MAGAARGGGAPAFVSSAFWRGVRVLGRGWWREIARRGDAVGGKASVEVGEVRFAGDVAQGCGRRACHLRSVCVRARFVYSVT